MFDGAGLRRLRHAPQQKRSSLGDMPGSNGWFPRSTTRH